MKNMISCIGLFVLALALSMPQAADARGGHGGGHHGGRGGHAHSGGHGGRGGRGHGARGGYGGGWVAPALVGAAVGTAVIASAASSGSND